MSIKISSFERIVYDTNGLFYRVSQGAENLTEALDKEMSHLLHRNRVIVSIEIRLRHF